MPWVTLPLLSLLTICPTIMALIQFSIFKKWQNFTTDSLEFQWPLGGNMGFPHTDPSMTYSFLSPDPHPPSSFSWPANFPLALLNPLICLSPVNTPTSSIPLSTSAELFPSPLGPSTSYSHLSSRPPSLLGVLKGLRDPKSKHLILKKLIGNRLDILSTQISFRYPDSHLVSPQSLAQDLIHSLHKITHQGKENFKGLLQ